MERRTFIALGAGALARLALPGRSYAAFAADAQTGSEAPEPFRISLAEWSLNKTLRAGKMKNLDFPRIARREFGIDCVEYVDQFFRDKAQDSAYLAELKQRCSDEGVTSGLIMIDTTGALGHSDPARRRESVEKTFHWIDAAKALGCHAVRVNAYGDRGADPDALRGHVSESCATLADFAAERGLNVVIENHGGPSSDPGWLVSVMRQVDKPNFGTLPDFGNFPGSVNRYDAVEKMMPFAKAVSAKSSRFTPEGLVAETDYFRMMRIVRDGGYSSWVGVESGARQQPGEFGAIEKTRDLLLRIREEQRRVQPIFNGRDLAGWVKIEGGEWTVEDGVLVGRNGQSWTTNPEKAGSWLRSEKQYGDFRLELQYQVNERGNSGIFFRSAAEQNPAFTGYELQVYGRPGAAPSKNGPSSIYAVAAPSKNLVRPEGQWNTVTIIARGPQVQVEMNGERVIDTRLERSLKGYIGLQNHDDRSTVKYRNVRIAAL